MNNKHLEMDAFKPVRILPFDINNVNAFLNQEHPVLHPQSPDYDPYWEGETAKCILGHWGYDYKDGKGGWRWMPGNLYFYVNMCVIKKEGESGQEVTDHPSLRDVDWYIFYSLAICEGFSGFENDKETSCFRPLGRLQRGEELSGIDTVLLKRYDKYLRKPDGEYKKYVDAREYLYNTIDEPMGNPLWLNECQNLVVLSSRRIGKSYSIGGGVIGYDFTFSGAYTPGDFFDGKSSTTTVVGSAVSDKSDELLGKTKEIFEHLRTNVGAYKGECNGFFFQKTTGGWSSGDILTNRVPLEGKTGYTKELSRIAHVSYKTDASAGVGHAAKKQVIEEAGLLGNFKTVHSENSPTQERDTKFGYSIYIGTGGNVEKIQGIRDAFYNPSAYQALAFDNVFSKRGKSIGLFVPAYYRKMVFKDENGNTDVDAAFKDEILFRKEKLKESAEAYEGHCISFPIVPEEMFMQSKGNSFPTAEIQKRIAVLESGEWDKNHSTGELHWNTREKTSVRFQKDMHKVKGIFRLDDERGLKGKEKEGRLVVYEHPSQNRPKRKYNNPMYIVLYDPVKNDGEGTSLSCLKVFKTWELQDFQKMQYNIVAEWYGRHELVEYTHDLAFKIACYYDATILPEVNDFDIVRYARKEDRKHWLQPKPTVAIKGMVNQKKDYEVGIYISKGMKPKAEMYLAEMMKMVVDKKEIIVESKYSVQEIRMVDKCPSIRFLEEALIYNSKDNFDGVSTMMLGGIWIREQFLNPDDDIYGENDNEEDEFMEFVSKTPRQLPNPAFNY